MVVRHTLWEGNSCADFLAKHGASQDEAPVLVSSPLEGMSLLLLANSMGVSFLKP